MLKIYTTEKDTDKFFLLNTYTEEVKDFHETIASCYANEMDSKKPLKVNVEYSVDASDFFVVEGSKMFLECYVVGCRKFGYMNLYVPNPILSALI